MSTRIDNNVVAMLDASAERVPERPALVFGDKTVSFRELSLRVHRFEALLKQRGLHRGERVIIMIPMSPDLYAVLLAVMRCGAVAVFVDPWVSMRQIATFSAFAEPVGFIGVTKSHLLRFLSIRLAALRFTGTTGRTFCGLPAAFSLRSAPRQIEASAPAAVSADDPALITFTTGSSGIPKGANRTHGFLSAQYEALCAELDYHDDDVDMPMFPVFALRNLAAGITSVIPQIDFRRVAKAEPDVIARQVSKHRVTVVTGSPPLIDRLSERDVSPSLRKIITGGAPVLDERLEQWQQAFGKVEIVMVYGSTEVEPVAHIESRNRLALRDASKEGGVCCGRPTERLDTRVIRICKGAVAAEHLDSLTLARGKIGELIVSGDHVCRDYFRNPAAVKENKIVEPDGRCWHRMGDTGSFDAQGRFWLVGRVHSTIMRNGRVLHARRVEAEIKRTLPSARRVAALEWQGELVVVIEGEREDVALDADHVIFVKKALPVDPRHNSKIDYKRLRRIVDKRL